MEERVWQWSAVCPGLEPSSREQHGFKQSQTLALRAHSQSFEVAVGRGGGAGQNLRL